MNNKKPVVGIDVSYKTFNTHWKDCDNHYDNNRKGWNKLLKEAPPNALYSMEATGNYHYKLAAYLHDKGLCVKVFNPLRVNRWIESTRGVKAKTDKINARDLFHYVSVKEVKDHPFWEPLSPKHARARVIVSLLKGLSKLEKTAGDMNHAASLVTSRKSDLLHSMKNVSFACNEEKYLLEKELCQLAKEIFPEQFRLLVTIPGIAARSASVFLIITKGLANFETREQLVSFIGLAPTVCESGTSVKGKSKIAKTGNAYLRKMFYMCAMSSIQVCEPCARLYNRLVVKGKHRELALVAVMHRLAKIAFGVIKSGEPYRGGRVNTRFA